MRNGPYYFRDVKKDAHARYHIHYTMYLLDVLKIFNITLDVTNKNTTSISFAHKFIIKYFNCGYKGTNYEDSTWIFTYPEPKDNHGKQEES